MQRVSGLATSHRITRIRRLPSPHSRLTGRAETLRIPGASLHRSFSTEQPAEAAAGAAPSPPPPPPPKEPPVFKYPKAQAMFEKITATCSKEDVKMIAHELNNILGRSFRPREFYYDGFGGRGGKSGGANAGAAAGGDAAKAAQPAAPDKVSVKLTGFDAKAKIKVIKEVRAIAGLGLKEAKELVESAPKVILKDLKPEAAEELKAKLEELGAQIELV